MLEPILARTLMRLAYAGIEALTGLMANLSTGCFFMALNRMFERD